MNHKLREHRRIVRTHRVLGKLMRPFASIDVENISFSNTTPVIHAANHRSFADLWLACETFRTWGVPVRPLVAASYFTIPGVGFLLRSMKCIPVEGTESLEIAKKVLLRGWSVAIMPEGRIVPKEEWSISGVGRARSGIGRLVIDTGLPVMVSGASGTECFWPRGNKMPYLHPWKSFPIALRSEYLGILKGTRSRDVTDQIMKAMEWSLIPLS